LSRPFFNAFNQSRFGVWQHHIAQVLRKANPRTHDHSTAMRCDKIKVNLVAGCSKLQSPFRQKGPTFTTIGDCTQLPVLVELDAGVRQRVESETNSSCDTSPCFLQHQRCPIRWRRSRNNLIDQLAMHIRQAEVAALEAVGEFFVIEPE